jgi:hypothetical protein
VPLPEGIRLTPRTPEASRPQQPIVAMEDVALRFPNGNAQGRRAQDNTNWCLCCDLTISPGPRAAFCADHRRERNTAQQRAGRGQDRPPVVGVPAEIVDTIVSKTDRLLSTLGRATAEFNRMAQPPVGSWIDDLMLVAKDLSLAVEYGLRPVSSEQRVSERERRRQATVTQEA